MLKNDNQCWIHLPVDLTDPQLTVEAAAAINAVHTTIGKPLVTAGGANPYFLVITQIGIAKGASIDRSGDTAACGPISNTDRIPLSLIDLVVLVGGEVEGLKVVFRFADPEAACPLDPTKTWNEWGKGTSARNEPREYTPYWYRSNEVDGLGINEGQALKASVWVPLKLSGQLTVITTKQYATIVQANQQGP